MGRIYCLGKWYELPEIWHNAQCSNCGNSDLGYSVSADIVGLECFQPIERLKCVKCDTIVHERTHEIKQVKKRCKKMAKKEYVTFRYICNDCGAVVANIDSFDTDYCPRCNIRVNYNKLKKVCSLCSGVVGECLHTQDIHKMSGGI